MALASSEWLCHVEAIDITLDTLGKQQIALQFIPMIGPGEASFLSPSINKKDSVLSSVISKSTRVLFMYTGFRGSFASFYITTKSSIKNIYTKAIFKKYGSK